MPVLLLAGAEELDVVRPLAARLLEDGGEVRTYLDEDDFELRNMGCKLAIGSLDDEVNLEAALTNVHTFIPILTDPARINDQSRLDSLLEFAFATARAAAGSGIAQTILPTSTASGSNNPLGEALLRVEHEFQERVAPLCVLRTGFLWGPSRPFPACLRVLGRSAARVPAEVRIGVVQVENFVALVAAADDREGLQGSWEFAGEGHSLRELQELAGEGDTTEPGPWLPQILADPTATKRPYGISSASNEFDVAATRAQPLNVSPQARTGGY